MKTVQYTTRKENEQYFHFATIYDHGFRFDSMIGLGQLGELKGRVEAKYPGIEEREYRVKMSELNLN